MSESVATPADTSAAPRKQGRSRVTIKIYDQETIWLRRAGLAAALLLTNAATLEAARVLTPDDDRDRKHAGRDTCRRQVRPAWQRRTVTTAREPARSRSWGGRFG